MNKTDLQSMIKNKEVERLSQDQQYKPVKTKVINGNKTTNDFNNEIQETTPNKNYIETYEEMKRGSLNKQNTQVNNNQKNNYDNILVGLKDLGIIK